MYYQQKSFQNNNQQSNQKQNVNTQTKTPELNDRDRINDILATEKYLTDSFNVFTKETSNNKLYSDIKQILNDTHNCTRDIFNIMNQKGFYNLEAAQQQKIQQAWNKFSNYINTQAPY